VTQVARGEPQRQCFHLFGFDVMFDAFLKPWLIEVNMDPSLDTESNLDRILKQQLLVDTFNVVGLSPPPTRAARRQWAASRMGRPPSAEAALEETRAADAAAAKAKAAEAVGAARGADAAKLAGLSEMDAWTVLLVDAEYRRSKNDGQRFRRLFPCPEREAYRPYLPACRSRHWLPFEMPPPGTGSGPEGDDEDPVKKALALASAMALSSTIKEEEREAEAAAAAKAAEEAEYDPVLAELEALQLQLDAACAEAEEEEKRQAEADEEARREERRQRRRDSLSGSQQSSSRVAGGG
jgi:hypothetical protein